VSAATAARNFQRRSCRERRFSFQRHQFSWAERQGHIVVKEYIEPGASETDDKRPVFQDMMADAAIKGNAPVSVNSGA